MTPFDGSWDGASLGAAAARHLWQSTAFAGACWAATLVLKRNGAAVRHGIWLAASLKFLLPFSILAGLGAILGGMADVRVTPADVPGLQSIGQWLEAPGIPDAGSAGSRAPEPASRSAALWIIAAAVWSAGFSAVAAWRLLRWRRLASLTGAAGSLRDGREVDALRRARARHGSRARVRLAVSPSTVEPGVRGVFRPVLVLPADITGRLDDDQLDAIVAHELCHIRRCDNLAAALHVIVETIFWFHPLVWWIGARLVEERERACDEDVLRGGSDPQVYAGAILRVCEFYLTTPATAMSRATGSNLRQRIEDIMTQRIVRKTGGTTRLLLAGTALVFAAVPVVSGMSGAPQRLTERPAPGQAINPATDQALEPAPGGPAPASAGALPPAGSLAPRAAAPAVAQAEAVPGVRPGTSPAAPEAQVPEQGDYTIGGQDELDIHAWGNPELTHRVVVRPDGKITFPLVGDVQATGLTPRELEREINRRLTRFLVDPRVTVIVAVATRPQVTIQGAIARPGLYPLSGRVTVLELIAQAGGLTQFARRDEIAVFRDVEGATETHRFNYSAFLAGVDVTQNLALRGGDIVIIP